MDLDQKLSPHFSLRELVITSHRTIDNSPSPDIVEQLRLLANNLLEPIRQRFGPLLISSGYRCRLLNAAIGGVPTSAHCFGCAADFMPADTSITTSDLVRWVKASPLAFDQVIDEHSSTAFWVHVGQVRPGYETTPRREALTFRNGVYSPFAFV